VKPKVKVWVAFSDDLKFGDGCARLLELVEQRGSLRQAANDFERSYRTAWGYLGELERAAGFKFVDAIPAAGPAAACASRARRRAYWRATGSSAADSIVR